MTKTISISLEEPQNKFSEAFVAEEQNIGRVSIYLQDGTTIPTDKCIVQFSLSKEAMIGLATYLLRAAHSERPESYFEELLPSEPDFAVLNQGIFLHPDSCRLNICAEDFGQLSKLLGENVG